MGGVLDASSAVLALAASVTLIVQLLKMTSIADAPWKKVAAAFGSATVLTVLLALSAGLLAVENIYGLISGAILATAAAVGIHASNTTNSG